MSPAGPTPYPGVGRRYERTPVDYNVTVELDGDQDPDELADELYSSEPSRVFALAIHSAPGGRVALTLTIDAEYVDAAVGTALGVARGVWGLRPYAVAALPTDEFDRRADLIAPVPEMMSVPEAAETLGVSQQRVRQLLDGKKLAGRKVGRDWLVSRAAVSRRLES